MGSRLARAVYSAAVNPAGPLPTMTTCACSASEKSKPERSLFELVPVTFMVLLKYDGFGRRSLPAGLQLSNRDKAEPMGHRAPPMRHNQKSHPGSSISARDPA